MLAISFLFFSFVYATAPARDTVLVFGGGPVGLWSAYQMLQHGHAQNVVVAEKRFQIDTNSTDWLKRNMVIQFHQRLFPLDFDLETPKTCPFGVGSKPVEEARKEFHDLHHMSVKNIQATLLRRLKYKFPGRFQFIQMKQFQKQSDHIEVTLRLSHLSNKKRLLRPDEIVDATGARSEFMHGMINTKYNETAINYGSGLKVYWPEHLVDSAKKQTNFHDCHTNSIYFNEGLSSTAAFSPYFPSNEKFITDIGFSSDLFRTSKPITLSIISEDLRLFMEELPTLSSFQYMEAVQLFRKIKASPIQGLDAWSMIKSFRRIGTPGAAKLATKLRRTINKTFHDPYQDGLEADKQRLQLVRTVFVPFRVEQYLNSNLQFPRVKIHLEFIEGRTFHGSVHSIKSIAVGDSLATTDYRLGLGINRGFSIATQLFQFHQDPEVVRKQFVSACYLNLDRLMATKSYDDWQKRADQCRSWLLKRAIAN